MKTTRTTRRAIPNLFQCKTAYEFGLTRGDATGRESPMDRDWQWVAQSSDCRMQCTDPDDALAFAQGMYDGANNDVA